MSYNIDATGKKIDASRDAGRSTNTRQNTGINTTGGRVQAGSRGGGSVNVADTRGAAPNVSARQRTGQQAGQSYSGGGSGQSTADRLFDEAYNATMESVAKWEAEKKAEEDRKAKESEDRRRNLDKIAAEEMQSAASQRKAKQRAEQEEKRKKLENQTAIANRVDQIASEEVSAAANDRQSKRQAALAAQAASNQRLDDMVEGTLQSAKNSLAAKNAARAASNQRLDDMADRAFDEVHRSVYGDSDTRGLDSTGFVDTETGEMVSTGPSAMTQAMQAAEGEPVDHMAARGKHVRTTGSDYRSARHSDPDFMLHQRQREEEAEREAERQESEPVVESSPDNPVRINPDDVTWRVYQDVTGFNSKEARLKRLRQYEDSRRANDLQGYTNESSYRGGNFDAQDRGVIEEQYSPLESEQTTRGRLQEMQDRMYRRFLNPALLSIESEYVETRTDKVNGETRTYGRIRYSDRVEAAIGSVRRLYGDCSITAVMQLVQLRAGLGIGIDGTIANVDPDQFHLTDDQFCELCRDIMESQKANGNPLGPVAGDPRGMKYRQDGKVHRTGVRDDSGRFVVVAGTRCFPLGYMPQSLIYELRKDWNSALHQYSERDIARMVGEQWLNQTYPELCANTGGNQMYQCRAIENMMRAVMRIDGKNPADLGIPENSARNAFMLLATEKANAGDPAIARAIDEREQRAREAQSRMEHRYRKENGTRNPDGSLKRRRTLVGDAFRGLSSMEMAAKASNFFLWISNPIEAGRAMMEQGIGNAISEASFRYFQDYLGDIDSQDYRMTDALNEIAEQQETIDALTVAENLFRMGGNTAVDAFFGDVDEDGTPRYAANMQGLNQFLADYGVISDQSISDRVRQMFGIKPGQENAFRANVRGIMNGMESMILGTSDLFKQSQTKQFVKMSLMEMGRAAAHNAKMDRLDNRQEAEARKRESYTASEVEQFAERGGGGAALIRSLMQTDAGREAFMTQGITSLGRKSPYDYALRQIIRKNGVTEFMIRSMFDRFPEYGMQKIAQQVPFSNTISYLSSCGISSMGDLFAQSGNQRIAEMGDAMSRMRDYQVGGRLDFFEGLRKNFMYDTVMAGSRLAMAAVYKGILAMFGGLFPPDDEDDEYTWSEWVIGSGEDAVPIKWAWWMDDLSGISLPLGTAWAIAEQGGYSPEAIGTATKVFENAIVNLNSGTALFDAIDLIKNFDKEIEGPNGWDIEKFDPDNGELMRTSVEIAFWDMLGDLTPNIVNQLLPWSRDYLFRGDSDARSATKVYSEDAFDEGKNPDMNTEQVGSYREAAWRRTAKNNALVGWLMNMVTGAHTGGTGSKTSYLYSDMPLSTMTDPLALTIWNHFDFQESDFANLNEERKFDAMSDSASEVVDFIESHYKNAVDAYTKGFVINPYARSMCAWYCKYQKNVIFGYDQQALDLAERVNELKLSSGRSRIPSDEYARIKAQVENEYQSYRDHYQYLYDSYFSSDSIIPWNLPKYIEQETDWETRYVDDNGRPVAWHETLSGNGHAEKYAYGNEPTFMPFYSPRTKDKEYNYETPAYWLMRDEDGNIVNDTEAIFNMLENMTATTGADEGKNLQELYYGGQGNNSGADGSNEQLNIPSTGAATISRRNYRLMEDTIPEEFRDHSDEGLAKLLGLPTMEEALSALAEEREAAEQNDSDAGGNSYGGYGDYGRSYYGGGYGRSYYGGGYSGSYSGSSYSQYNPKIYSSPKSVYAQRASGLNIRTPYKATTTYLRPAFYTKGSREAYRRSDI